MRKKVDPRIRTLIENGIRSRHRSMFVVVGDRGRDQIVNLHYMLVSIGTVPILLPLLHARSCHRKKPA